MIIKNVNDPEFRQYGRIVENIDFSELLEVLGTTPVPEGVAYEPSVAELEALPVSKEIQSKCYGELPIQIGYCNGHNAYLNALEYHRSSEINIAATDAVLMLGLQQDITKEFTYDTNRVEAFFVPKGTAVEVYATTLHYAPCNRDNAPFQVAVVLPKGTNYELTENHKGWEDALITATNKWLIGHKEGGLDAGAHIGLIGKNLNINE